MKRIWMSALLLLTALFAARAQAETVYDRGTMYGVMTVYEQPDSLSDVRMVYFSGTPVEVLESVEDGAGQVFTHVCVANQLEGYVLTRDSGENEVVLFSEGRRMGRRVFCRCLWRIPADGESSICGIGRAEGGGFLRKFRTVRRSR
ncbi:MAG: hypothetical protein ACLR07_12415 [Christensenellales bacterium]